MMPGFRSRKAIVSLGAFQLCLAVLVTCTMAQKTTVSCECC